MATTEVTPTYLFPYPTGEDSLSNVAQRIQDLAQRIETTYGLMGIDTSFTNLLQSGDTAGGSLTGTYPNPTIANSAVTTARINDSAVTTIKIADSAVTTNKIANSVNLSGNPTTTTQDLMDTSTRIATTQFVNGVAANFVLGVLSAGSITSSMLAPMTYIDFNTASPAALQEGRLVWDDAEGVLTMGIKGNPVPLYIGEQVMDRVTNVQGSTINALSAVRVFGSSGNRLTVKLAQADLEANSTATFGITTASIADNQSGYTISQGLIKDVNTASLTEGASVWLSPSVAGGLTTTKPVAPDNLVLLGFCVKQHATTGILLVKIVNGFELDELHDVQISSPVNNDLLQYSTTGNVWKNVATIAKDKITGTAVTQADTGTVTSTMIADNTIVNNDINASAGIVYSKLSLTGSIAAADMSTAYPGHLVVANTAARPAAPTIGQMIYQSDTGEFLKYVTDIDSTNRWMQVHTAYTPNRNMVLNASMNVNQRTLGPIQLTNKVANGTTVTLTTSTPHGLRSGCVINVACSPADANIDGTYTVNGTPSATTITYAKAVTVATAATGGALTVAVQNITATATGGAIPYTMLSGYATTDRWKTTLVTHGTYTHSVERDAPAATMLRNSFKTLVTTANTTLTGAQECRLSQTIEGQEAQVIRKGTANALPTVLSFWVKSGTTGTYIIELTDSANARSISQSYTISTANTWEKKVILIPADTTGVLYNDNTTGLELSFWLGAGANYTGGGSLQNTWGSTTANKRAFGQTNLAAGAVAATNYWQLTGVQFEVGTAPSELEVVKVEDDLLRCQRYYYRLTSYATTNANIGTGLSTATTTNAAIISLPVSMRIAPTLVETTGTIADYGVTNGAGAGNAGATSVPNITGTATVKSIGVLFTVGAVLTAGQAGNVYFSSTNGAYLGFNADF